MAETSYPSSDVDSGELELANDWLKQAIYKEVSRGSKLRERKLGPLDVTSKYSKPPTPAKSGIYKDRRKPSPSPNRTNGWDQMRGRARSNSPFQSTRTSTPLSRRDSSSTSTRRGRPVCSMRISELAVPTKRQCIDTWRKKASVLPEAMVHRLKQQVMDQTPIIKISDAVNCFSQSSSVTSKKRPPRKINKEAMMTRNKEETQYISTIFGHKIAQKLIRPVNANLNSQLQNVSSVISSEICNIMRDKTKLKTDLATHERMVRETADKVTIWIANILEETSEKLLEEDLKVKKFHERASFVTDGDLITVIGTIMCQESELEEQEGPALDILDDLVDNVVSVCAGAESDLEDIFDAACSLKKSIDNISTTDYISVSSGNNDETDPKAISPVQQALREYLDESDKKPADEEESLKNDLIKQLNEIIDSNVIDNVENTNIVEDTSKEINKQSEPQTNFQENPPESILVSKDSLTDIKLLEGNQEHNHEQINVEREQNPSDEALNVADSGSEKQSKFDESLYKENNNVSIAENEAHSDKMDNNKIEDSIFLLDGDQVTDSTGGQNFDINEEQKPEALNLADSGSEKGAKLYESLTKENSNNSIAKIEAHSDKIDNDQVDDHIFSLADEQVTDSTGGQNFDMNDEQKTNIQEEQKSNRSIALSEDRDKKVQFSYDNFGPLTELKKSILSAEKLTEKASGHLKQAINKGKSHDNPLRDMNESWPEDLSFENLTKPGESVSKSVTSLGKILESDERNILSPEETLSEQNQRKDELLHLHPESIEQFNNFGINYEDFILNNDENNGVEKQTTALVEVNRTDLHNAADPKRVFEDRIEKVSGETEEPYGKQAITAKNQEETIVPPTHAQAEGTSGVLKPQTNESVDQQELTAQIKAKELEASLIQLKREIKSMNIQNESSEPSLVSVMLSKLQKHDDKLQENPSDPELSHYDINKMHTALSERSKYVPYSSKRKLYQRPLSPAEMAPKKFDYRVHPSTAPAWIRRGRGQGDLGGCPRPQSYSDTNGMRERELEIRKRCKDLDKIIMNLEKWKNWLEYITKYISSLKEKAELNKPTPLHTNKTVTCDRPKPPRNLEKPSRNIEKEMWTKLNHRAKGGLKLCKNNETIKLKVYTTITV